MTAQREHAGLAANAFVDSCILGTIVLLSLTHEWLEVAFFTFFLVLGLFQLMAPGTYPRSRPEPVLRRQLGRIQVGFWILTFAAAVAQLRNRSAGEAPVIVWYVRFATMLAWSFIWHRRHRPT
jgi:hypothetical protein